jgi:hypothetical protein
MLRCEKAGLPVVMHTHDEIVSEVSAAGADEALRRQLTIMSRPPAWAEEFPAEVEGFVTYRYLKVPPPGALTARARDGAVIEEVRDRFPTD